MALHVRVGPMFSGKTSWLLGNLSEDDLYIGHSLDDRGKKDIFTHDGIVRTKTKRIFSSDLLTVNVEDHMVIGVDEGQFFGSFEPVLRWVEEGRTVYVAGLDSNFERLPFGFIYQLLPSANTFSKMSAKCNFCDEEAGWTMRMVDVKDSILIGGSDLYQPTCRKCHK